MVEITKSYILRRRFVSRCTVVLDEVPLYKKTPGILGKREQARIVQSVYCVI